MLNVIEKRKRRESAMNFRRRITRESFIEERGERGRMMSIGEAAKYMNGLFAERSVRTMVYLAEIPAHKFGSRVFLYERELDRYMELMDRPVQPKGGGKVGS